MNSEPDTLLPGTLLGGKYRLAGIIGKGGFGAVFRGTSIANGAPVAVKILARNILSQSGGVERFRREATLASRLNHPNTVRVLDSGEDARGWLFIVFELLEGESVEQALAERGAMNVERAAGILADACSALEEAHGIGIIHRDLKPGNIFLVHDPSGKDRAKVLDFGIAKSTTGTQAGLTRDGSTMGTPIYMSPEQILGQPVTPTSDIFSLGIVLADMLLGMSPYGRDPHAIEVITDRINGKPVPLPDDLARSRAGGVIIRATQTDASRRFRSAGEMRAALMALLPTMNTMQTGPVQAFSTAPTMEVRAVVSPKLAATMPSDDRSELYAPPTIRDPSGSSYSRLSPVAVTPPAPAPPKKSRVAAVLVAVFVGLITLGVVAGLLLYFQPGPLKGILDPPKPKKRARTEAAAQDAASDSPRSTSSVSSAKPSDAAKTDPTSSASASQAGPTGTPAERHPCPRIDSLSRDQVLGELNRQGLVPGSEDTACDGSEVNGTCMGHERTTFTLKEGVVTYYAAPNEKDLTGLMQHLDEESGARTFAVGSTHLLVSTLPLANTKPLLRQICGQ